MTNIPGETGHGVRFRKKGQLQLLPIRATDGSILKETNKPSCQVSCHINPSVSPLDTDTHSP